MRGKHQTDYQPGHAIKWISKPIQRVHTSSLMMLILSSRWRRYVSAFAGQQRINATTARTIENHKEKYPAQNDSKFSLVQDREKLLDWAPRLSERLARGVHHKIGNGHFTAGNERGQTREQSKCDQESAYEFHNSAHQHQTMCAAVSTTGKTKKLLPTMTGIDQSHDQPHDAVNWVCKSIQKVHGRQAERSRVGVSRK